MLIGLAKAKWTGWHWADHVAAILVAGKVLWIGGALLWENVQSLIDRQADPDLLQHVRGTAQAVPGELEVEGLRVGRTGI